MSDQIKHVVGLSGGKDSTCMALLLVEKYQDIDFEFICNETGNELPEMLAHWELLERLLGKPLKRVRHTKDLAGMIADEKAIPNWRQRFCTRILKIEPTVAYMRQLPDDSVLYVGLRADEEPRKGLETSTLLAKLNAGDYAGVPSEFPKWNKNEGKVMRGLIRRRAAEVALFSGKSGAEAIAIGVKAA